MAKIWSYAHGSCWCPSKSGEFEFWTENRGDSTKLGPRSSVLGVGKVSIPVDALGVVGGPVGRAASSFLVVVLYLSALCLPALCDMPYTQEKACFRHRVQLGLVWEQRILARLQVSQDARYTDFFPLTLETRKASAI